MSISIAELIKLTIYQPKIQQLMRIDEPTFRGYIKAIDSIPELNNKHITKFVEFIDYYDSLLEIMTPHVKPHELSLLRSHKNAICALVLEIFDFLI